VAGITLKYCVQLNCNMKQCDGKKTLFLFVSRNYTNTELVYIKIPSKCREKRYLNHFASFPKHKWNIWLRFKLSQPTFIRRKSGYSPYNFNVKIFIFLDEFYFNKWGYNFLNNCTILYLHSTLFLYIFLPFALSIAYLSPFLSLCFKGLMTS